MDTPILEQTDLRFRDDDGDETAATWRQLINVDDTQDVDTVYRIRIVIKETAGFAAANCTFQLQYNHEGGGWTNASGASTVIDASVISQLVDNVDTTQQLSSPDSFVSPNSGQEETNGAAGGPTLDFAGNDTVEVEIAYSIIGSDVTPGDNIDLRVSKTDLVYTRASIRVTVASAGPTPQSVGGYDLGPIGAGPKKTSKVALGGYDEGPIGVLASATIFLSSTGGYTLSPIGTLTTKAGKNVGAFTVTPTGTLVRKTAILVGEYTLGPTGIVLRNTKILPGTYDLGPTGTLTPLTVYGKDVGGYTLSPTGELVTIPDKAVGGFDEGPTAIILYKTSKAPGGFGQAPTGTLVPNFIAGVTQQGVGDYDENPLGALVRQVSKFPGGYDQNPTGTLVRKMFEAIGEYDLGPTGDLSTDFTAGGATPQAVGGYDENPIGTLVRMTLKAMGGYDEAPTGVLIRYTKKALLGAYDLGPLGDLSGTLLKLQVVGGFDLAPFGTWSKDRIGGGGEVPPAGPVVGAYPILHEHRSRIRRL